MESCWALGNCLSLSLQSLLCRLGTRSATRVLQCICGERSSHGLMQESEPS